MNNDDNTDRQVRTSTCQPDELARWQVSPTAGEFFTGYVSAFLTVYVVVWFVFLKKILPKRVLCPPLPHINENEVLDVFTNDSDRWLAE